MKFQEGDIVSDSSGRIGVVVAVFETIAGIFYNVLLGDHITSFPEEELVKKD